jgi:hypothetical protein
MSISENRNQNNFEERANGITIRELKKIGDLEDCSEQQAIDLTLAAKAFASIIYDIWAKEQNNNVIVIEVGQPIEKAA